MTDINTPSLTDHRSVTPHSLLKEKLAELHDQMKEECSKDKLLSLVQQCRELVDPLDDYLSSATSSPSEELDQLENSTNTQDWDQAFAKATTQLHLEKEMLSGGVEGQFLKMLTATTKAKNILEIGSFTGYASLAMAEALPPDGELIACEYDPFTAEFARSQLDQSAHGSKIKILTGDALETLQNLSSQKATFDLIFIDADKVSYQAYYDFILDHHLLEADGLICVDNTLYMGQVYGAGIKSDNGKAIEKFNQSIADDPRVHQVLLPLRDGFTLIRRLIK